MKININMDSIVNKINSSGSVKAKMSKATSANGKAIAYNLANELVNNINSNSPDSIPSAPASFDGVSDLGDNKYKLGVRINYEFRPSLVPERYGGVTDMFALFNNGYVANSYVYGMWHGSSIRSLVSRFPSHFIQDSVDELSDGDSYKIVDKKISNRFW